MSARVGLVGLETSHPQAFVGVLRDLGHKVTAVLDPAAMRGGGYAAAFAAEYDVDVVARDLEELAAACDVAILLEVDWDLRLEHVRRLRAAGVAVLVDKPVAGRAGDLRAFAALGDEAGPRVTGGSSLRTAPEGRAWRDLGRAVTSARVSCSGPPLYYGVHAVSLAVGILGEGLVAARSTAVEGVLTGEIRHAGGATITVEVPHVPAGAPFRATLRRDTGDVDVVEPAGAGLYRPFLAACLDHLTGGAPAPASAGGLVEPELALLAMAWSASRPEPGGWVGLDETPDDWQPWTGADFAREYREGLGA